MQTITTKSTNKTYVVEWYNRTKNCAWKNYKRIVQTNDIESYVRNTMKLVVGCCAFEQYRGTFASATEVCKTDKLGHRYYTVEGGEYWFTEDDNIKCGTFKWRYFYDSHLKCWII